MANSRSWQKIFDDNNLDKHDFDKSPFLISAAQIKKSVQKFKVTSEKEIRILCKQDTREQRPQVFIDKGLFLLPTKNGYYAVVKGEGFIDIPEIDKKPENYSSKLDFRLETSEVGNSEMQHLDFAYASSLVRTFMNDSSLVLTIRGRKYTPHFEFFVGGHKLVAESVQTEVDAGYEGKDKVVLIEAKNTGDRNLIIRQLYYPYRQWQEHTKKKVYTIFFERDNHNTYSIWEFEFTNLNDYNSIKLVKSGKFIINTEKQVGK